MKKAPKKSAKKNAPESATQSPSITPEAVAAAAIGEWSRLSEKVESMKSANFSIEFGDIKIIYSGPITK